MLRSLFSGITGLRAHQTLMDVVSNNISNVNTTGFKSSSVIFEDTLSQMVKSSGAATANLGGVNPAQVGLGVQLGGISSNFGQGSAQNTGKSTDLMIQGDGFFVVRNGGEQAYTRAGAFSFDTNGTLVTPNGMIVQGWMKDPVTGLVNSDGPAGDITVPVGTIIPPSPSTGVSLGGNIPNIPPGTTPTPNPVMTLAATAYDTAGNAHPLSATLTWNGSTNVYDISVTDSVAGSTLTTPGTVGFTVAGAYDPTTSAAPVITLADGTAITFDLTKITSFGGPKSLNVTASDGAASGSLQQFQIGSDGSVIGLFSNGQKLTMAKIALANFNNPQGLEKMGDTAYRSSANSGLPQVGTPGSGGRGDLLGGAIEMSNVDLAQEFTNLIIAQRGFQANSRVITTSDQMLQDLVDLKR